MALTEAEIKNIIVAGEGFNVEFKSNVPSKSVDFRPF